MFFMIIILIQKYNVTKQGINLRKMPLFNEVKTFEYIHVTLKWKKKKNIYKPEIHLQKC